MNWGYRLLVGWLWWSATWMISYRGIGFVVAVLGMLPFYIAMQNIRCPRCRHHVSDNGQGYHAPWIPDPTHCIKCGRHTENVWPFQWKFRPEAEEQAANGATDQNPRP